MKANELSSKDLMVGDWVMLQGKPYMIDMLNGYQESSMGVEPIPLTPEILEKNGLDNDPLGCYFDEDEDVALEISSGKEGIYWTINYHEYDILKLQYVHQLQHALRLCGINKEIEL